MSQRSTLTSPIDRRGLPLTTREEPAAQYREGMDRLLALAQGAMESFEAAITLDPRFSLGYSGLALVHFVEGRESRARATLVSARDALAGREHETFALTPRERHHMAIIAAGVGGDIPRAFHLGREHLREFPRDIAVLGLLVFLALRRDVYLRLAAEQLLVELAPEYGDDWAFLTLRATLFEDLGRLDEALSSALRAIALHPATAQAAHVVAHVRYERGEHLSGRRFLVWWLGLWTPAAPLTAHLRWHEGLFALGQGDRRGAISRYQQWIYPVLTSGAPGGLADGASLLWRLALDGEEGLLDWSALRREAAALIGGTASALTDLHTALALAGAGDLEALDRLATAQQDRKRLGDPLAGDVVLPIAIGLRAFASGDYRAAAAHIEPALGRLSSLGGQRAQNEVFEDTLIEAHLRAGNIRAAEWRLRARLNRRPSQRDIASLERVLAGLLDTAGGEAERPRFADDWIPDTEPSPSPGGSSGCRAGGPVSSRRDPISSASARV